MKSPGNLSRIDRGTNGVSPVIAVILMVAITVILSGVVFMWANSLASDSGRKPEYFHVRPEITSTGGSNPEQKLTIELLKGSIDWEQFYVIVDDVELNSSSNLDLAGDTEVFDIPNGDYPEGGIDLQKGIHYHVKIISYDQIRIVFNDVVMCVYLS